MPLSILEIYPYAQPRAGLLQLEFSIPLCPLPCPLYSVAGMDMADEMAGNQSSSGIRFGTDGWRAIIGDQFTFDNVARVAQAYAQYLLEQQGKKVVVGYDTRFMAGKFAQRAASVLAANGLEVHLSRSYVPTPVLSFAVKHLQADGGVMITASHNPAEYLGFKIKGNYAGAATPALVSEVEKHLGAEPKYSSAAIQSFDVRKPYYDFLASQLDMEALRAYEGVMYHDSLGGAGAGWLAGFVKHAGLKLDLRELHAVPDPMFYGVHPEPIPQNQFTIMTVLKAEQDPTFAAINDATPTALGPCWRGAATSTAIRFSRCCSSICTAKGYGGGWSRPFRPRRL